MGNGARAHRDAVIELAEKLDAPVITTFRAKGLIADDHPLACGVVGRSGDQQLATQLILGLQIAGSGLSLKIIEGKITAASQLK